MTEIRNGNAEAALRPLPNEDVFLFVKPFDNSHIVREADPGEGRMCWRAFGATIVTAVVLVVLIAPAAARWITAYQIEQVQRERDTLRKRRDAVLAEVTELKSMPRLQAVAREKGMVETDKSRVAYLQPAVKGALAMNLQAMKNPAQ